jgi:hypothetical protein
LHISVNVSARGMIDGFLKSDCHSQLQTAWSTLLKCLSGKSLGGVNTPKIMVAQAGMPVLPLNQKS